MHIGNNTKDLYLIIGSYMLVFYSNLAVVFLFKKLEKKALNNNSTLNKTYQDNRIPVLKRECK